MSKSQSDPPLYPSRIETLLIASGGSGTNSYSIHVENPLYNNDRRESYDHNMSEYSDYSDEDDRDGNGRYHSMADDGDADGVGFSKNKKGGRSHSGDSNFSEDSEDSEGGAFFKYNKFVSKEWFINNIDEVEKEQRQKR